MAQPDERYFSRNFGLSIPAPGGQVFMLAIFC